jgi:hypothetical protein
MLSAVHSRPEAYVPTPCSPPIAAEDRLRWWPAAIGPRWTVLRPARPEFCLTLTPCDGHRAAPHGPDCAGCEAHARRVAAALNRVYA